MACACLLVQAGSQVALQYCSAEEQCWHQEAGEDSLSCQFLSQISQTPRAGRRQALSPAGLYSTWAVPFIWLHYHRSSFWKCFIGSEIVASAVVGVAEESVVSDREGPLSSRELVILPLLVVQYFLSFPSPVKRTFVYSSGCQAPA